MTYITYETETTFKSVQVPTTLLPYGIETLVHRVTGGNYIDYCDDTTTFPKAPVVEFDWQSFKNRVRSENNVLRRGRRKVGVTYRSY